MTLNKFVILHGGTTTSWKSSKLTLLAISTNHSEIITLYEASQNDQPHTTVMWHWFNYETNNYL